MTSSSTPDDVRAHNRDAWDRQVAGSNLWTIPVDAQAIERARRGDWSVVLTGLTPVPRDWFPELAGADVLCLASGGGQQGPILAAAGGSVTVLDNSPAQLAQDRKVSDAHDLGIRTLEGDMADLSAFDAASFDLVFHPVSNLFVPDVRPVWREAYRVLRPGGVLLAGFMNPALFIFDWERIDRTGELDVRYTVPFSELEQLPSEELAAKRGRGEPLEFGHTLGDQIGGQLDAGFVLTALYDNHADSAEGENPVDRHLAVYLATRALKLAGR